MNEKEKLDVSIAPNPATTQFTIRLKGPAEAYTVTIFNAQGKSCYSGEMHDSTTEISTESLSKGVYFVTLQNKTNRQTKKLIVQ
jgi:hypothetical protein